MNEMPNKSLHRTAIPLRSIAAGELGRSRRAARDRTKLFEPLEF